VVMLALHGFDAYGLEVSQKAVDTANAYAQKELAQPCEYNFSSDREAWPDGRRGNVKFVRGDFFRNDWEDSCISDGLRGFDLIYDYTASVHLAHDPKYSANATLFSFFAPFCRRCEKTGLVEWRSCSHHQAFLSALNSLSTRISEQLDHPGVSKVFTGAF
jgi:hypothetical protein